MRSLSKPLTNSVQEKLGLGWEVVVDDVVQQGDVYTTGSNIGHKKHHSFSVHKLPDVDLSGSLIQGAVYVSTLDALRRKQLEIKMKTFRTNLHKVIRPLQLSFDCISPPSDTLYGVWWQQKPLSAPEASPHSSGDKVALPVCRPHAGEKMPAEREAARNTT